MSSSRWQRIQELFEEALGRPVQERASFLENACCDDSELRLEVESLLEHDEQASPTFLSPAQVAGGDSTPPPSHFLEALPRATA